MSSHSRRDALKYLGAGAAAAALPATHATSVKLPYVAPLR